VAQNSNDNFGEQSEAMPQLKPPEVVGLAQTQEDFDRYQLSAFPARVPEFFALELAGECGELANLEKKIWREPSRKDCIQELGGEAADVFIALMNYCNSRKLDLQAEVTKKLQKIELRRVQGLMGKVR
jgi:NTP pyrophosphatase (non-canonical NTP hydrolase)